MTNNDIFKKLRVAHKLKDTDIVEILALVDFRVTKSELSAFFRREDHPNYVECGDQILRNFLILRTNLQTLQNQSRLNLKNRLKNQIKITKTKINLILQTLKD